MGNKKTETGAMNNQVNTAENTTLKTAVVAIIGRPSAGKSTFLNTACQEDVSIVSPIPQTTRNAIKGIVNTSFGQLIFVDTPGYHVSEKKLNLKLKAVTEEQLEGVDCVLYIIDSTRPIGEEELHAAELIKKYETKTVVAINKTDNNKSLEHKYDFYELGFDDYVEISGEHNRGIGELLDIVTKERLKWRHPLR